MMLSNESMIKLHGFHLWSLYPNQSRQEKFVCVCVDMRRANQAIKRERHITPTINEIIHDLNGACIFLKLDLNQGYNQLELDESSRYMTTFSSHLGLWRYKRLSFGIKSAAEVFQNAIRVALSDLKGVCNISDDILVYGRTPDEHNTNLRNCFQRIRDSGLTLNKTKCVFNKSSLDFFGHTFSEGGIRVDPEKVEAVVNLPNPSNRTEIRSLLGMANFFSRFIPHYATIKEPLRLLTHKQSKWQWSAQHNHAFDQLCKDQHCLVLQLWSISMKQKKNRYLSTQVRLGWQQFSLKVLVKILHIKQ